MIIPDAVRKCVVFVGYRNNDGEMLVKGTAFLVSRDREGGGLRIYCVTAAHVLEGLAGRTATVSVRINLREGGSIWVDKPLNECRVHPDDHSIDIGLIPAPDLVGDDVDHMVFPLEQVLSDEVIAEFGIGLGDEVFLTGLFSNHVGAERNIPIVRVGNIAARPEEHVQTERGPMEAYLIEVRSIGGLSGSPVFASPGVVRQTADGRLRAFHDPPLFLMGLMHGHFPVMERTDESREGATVRREQINTGIGIVVPAARIIEVIDRVGG
jgi:hypothetical protein